MTSIKKYNDFLREWGTDANKPHILATDKNITILRVDDEEEEEETKDIPILQDLDESVHPEDPYGEENWTDPSFDYIQWKKEKKRLYRFLKQFNNPFIENCLKYISLTTKREIEKDSSTFDEILYELDPENEDSPSSLDQENYNAVKRDIDDLLELCEPDDEDYDEGPDPDEWYDRMRERELD